MRNGKKRPVGDPINFRGMANAPANEVGVIALFCMIARDLGMYIQDIQAGFPDCIIRRDIGTAWEELAVEFEFESRTFLAHGHEPSQADVIICWRDNWDECPAEIEVIQLSEEIKKLSNQPIIRPDRPY